MGRRKKWTDFDSDPEPDRDLDRASEIIDNSNGDLSDEEISELEEIAERRENR